MLRASSHINVTSVSRKNAMISIAAWLLIGFAAGFLANRLAGKRGRGLWLDLLLGTVGASLAGFAVNTIGALNRGELSFWSLSASAFGAGMLLVVPALVAGTREPSRASDQLKTKKVRR